jgi:hypothetical protein
MKHCIVMPMDKFVAEHNKLIKVLGEGKKAEMAKEAERQAAELKRVMGHPGDKPQLMLDRPRAMKRNHDTVVHSYD